MANLEAADTRLSFDDILEAVQDSRRGRWFLQEYEARLQKRDSQSILQAINRLENRMEALGGNSQSSPDDLARVRNAIANARNDLLKLGLGKDAMSKEGRLFAEIAELARKSMPVAVDSNAGIVRTLQLAEEIETAISAPAAVDKGEQYFKVDAALFEQAPQPKPALVTTPVVAQEPPPSPAPTVEPVKAETPKPEKKEEPAQTGARLVIRKASPVASTAPEAAAPAPADEPAAPAAADIKVPEPENAAAPATELPAMDNPRIVIIRRRAEDMPEVDVSPRQDAPSAA